jgi:PKD repeat protein
VFSCENTPLFCGKTELFLLSHFQPNHIMDKRILMVIACAWFIALSVFVYQKVYSADRVRQPVYETSIRNNTTTVGEVNRFRDKTEGATRWKWNFGDDQYSFEQEPEHIYTEPGNYTVVLTAYGSFGHIKDDTKTITVEPARTALATGQAEISGPESVTVGSTARFAVTTAAESYEWTVTGEPQYANQPLKTKEITLNFATPGAKTVSLKMHEPDQTITKTVQVSAAEVRQTTAPALPKAKPSKPAPSKTPAKDDWNLDAKDL